MNCSSWMQKIPDDVNISSLSIPGTHNSAACFKFAPLSVQCQGRSIKQQLLNGVRFLDMTLSKNFISRGAKVDDLIVVHGKFPVKLSGPYKFKSVLNDVYHFLDKFPTETVLMSIRFENTMLHWDPKIDEFAKVLFERYIAHNRRRWYLSSKIPSLKYSRGKIVLLRRFPVIENGVYQTFGISCTSECENSTSCIQECSSIKSQDDIQEKVSLIKGMISKASDYHSPSRRAPKLFINYCTGANYLKKNYWPSKVDKRIREFNIEADFQKNCGIVIFDFADRDDWKLVRKLILSNF
ncbi:1-phosphatidylinositol phosphodiesterase [Pichia kudriavzevii]|uniref:1-phosphatidylinositol phosphodiesterase n=1 Tax=Pichia kudriavzevii TaxID=4909 RepID=A0A1V2LMY6_PICKU|nr:1-phosphatidylinositol phosphodiesterase [Pichia kudriavzevii]